MFKNQNLKNVCSLIILYNPNVTITSKCINSLSNQVNEIFLIDNSKKNHKKIFNKYNVTYIHTGKNIGIAAAQNLGISEIRKKKYKFVILSDQDTNFNDSYSIKMITKYNELSKKNKIAALSPVFYNINNNKVYPAINRKGFLKIKSYNIKKDIIVSETISSGLFVNLDVFENIGKMNEELFIDWVDYEWCWRAKKNGYSIFMVANNMIHHNLGKKNKNIFLYKYPKHNKKRYYYIFRNGFYLILYSKNIPKLWKINIFFDLIKYFFGFWLIENLNINFIKIFFNSIKDSFVKKMGSNEVS